ncbi:hypothetical protein B296_00014593 [Ensete ventricosum]|uniref:Uncharacterized protein n=1 Tax=Ensete ventricosum TaxID=4639 RepID=A0A426ZU65_ENSVE|nr:hypothetical protein B296_00014593 [Ensete ventricosum]
MCFPSEGIKPPRGVELFVVKCSSPYKPCSDRGERSLLVSHFLAHGLSDLVSQLANRSSRLFTSDQVGMASSPSLSVSNFSSALSSPIPSPRVGEARPSGSSGGQSGPSSLSSGVMTRADVKALQALEVMKLYHDFDSSVSLESLAIIRKYYCIPNEYPADPPSPSKVQEIPPKEATRKAPAASGKHPIESPTGYLDFGRQPENRAGGSNSTTEVAEQDSRDCVRAMGATGGNSRTMENELLQLTRAMDALRVDLPKWAIEDYKKLPGFEMGLVRMGWVSLEFGYQLALARLWA